MSGGGVLPGTWTLIFSGSSVVTSVTTAFVQSFRHDFQRLTPIAERQNLWAPQILLDGRYPAQRFNHTFEMYVETSTPTVFAGMFFNLESQISSDPLPLILQDNGTDRIDFGSCYMQPPRLQDPQDLLLYRAGFITLNFLGSVRPTIL